MKIVKNLIRYFIWILSFFLSYIIPKKKNLYIFISVNWKTFSWNSKAMFLYYLKNDKSKEVYYITKDKDIISILENKFDFLVGKLILVNNFYRYWKIFRAEYIFTDWDIGEIVWFYRQPWNIKIINLWHWDPIKKIWIDNNEINNKIEKNIYKNYWKNIIKITTVSSNFFKKNMNSAFYTNSSYITWLARNDIFFRDDLEIYNIKKYLDINNYNKIILYTPTWRDDKNIIVPLSMTFLTELNKYCLKNNYIFLIKAHQHTKSIIIEKFSNIKNISNVDFDIQELLKYTDLLISDYSSIFIDYILTNKPIILYTYDLEEYTKKRSLYCKYDELINKVLQAKTEEELFNKIKKFNENNLTTEYKKYYNELKMVFHKYQKWWYINNIINCINNL